jgi:hypothetical protein
MVGAVEPSVLHPGLPEARLSNARPHCPVTGTYTPGTKAFVLSWASQVAGGPFNGFTGYRHLQGTFAPAT